MADIKLMVSRPSGRRTQALAKAEARGRVEQQLRRYATSKGRRMRTKLRGKKEEFGIWRQDLAPTMESWDRLVANNGPGEVILIDIEDYPYTVGTRIVDVTPNAPNTEGNDDIDKIHGWILRNLKGHSGGICNRRTISGTTTWTQHCPWPAPDPGSNAEDWFAFPNTMSALYDQGAELANAAKKNPKDVPVGLILVGNRAWTPQLGWHGSSAEYHRHLHIEGRTKRTGQPRSSCP